MRRTTLVAIGWTFFVAAAIADAVVAPKWGYGLLMTAPGILLLSVIQRRGPKWQRLNGVRGFSIVLGGVGGLVGGYSMHYVSDRYVATLLLVLVAFMEIAMQAWLRRQHGLAVPYRSSG